MRTSQARSQALFSRCKNKMAKMIKVSDSVHRKTRALSNILSRKEFSGAKISISDAVGYAVAKALDETNSKKWFKLKI